MNSRLWRSSTLHGHWLRTSACNQQLSHDRLTSYSSHIAIARALHLSVWRLRYKPHISRDFDLLLEGLNLKPISGPEPKPANGVLGCWPCLDLQRSFLVSQAALTRMPRWHGYRNVASRSRSPLVLRIIEGAVQPISWMGLSSRIQCAAADMA